MKKSFILILTLIICGCGGAAEEADYPDLDQILTTPETDIDISQGTHLPAIFNGTFELKKIETRLKNGDLISEEIVDPSASIIVTATNAEPYDTFTASSNLITKETIEVSGMVSLDIASGRLIVKVESSNTASIAEGKTYCLYFGASSAGGFNVTIEGNIKDEKVDQIYIFEKST